MFSCPVRSYITFQPPAMERLNIQIKLVHSMSYYIFMSTFCFHSHWTGCPHFCIYMFCFVSRLKSDNVWSFNALLAPFMTSFHYSIAFLIISYGPSLCMVYIYISAYCSSPRYDNYTPISGWGLGSAFLLLCFLLLVSLTVSMVCSYVRLLSLWLFFTRIGIHTVC